MPSAIRACGVLLVLSHTALAAHAADIDDSRAPVPALGIRADHMVLDLMLHGDHLLVGTQSGRVDVYDRHTGEALQPLFVEPARPGQAFVPTVRSLAIAPSGAELAVVTSDGRLRRFALGSESRLDEARLVAEREVAGLMVARYLGDRQILLADMRGELALLDTERGIELHRRQLDYDPIYAMELSPDRSLLAVAFRSSRVQVVAPETGETRFVLKGHLDSVFDVEWSGDHELVTGGKDKQVFAWDLRDSDFKPRRIYRGDHYITALGIDRQGGRMAFSVDGFNVALMRLDDRHVEQRFQGHTSAVHRLLFADGGRQLITGGYDARVFVWKTEPEFEQDVRRR